MEVLVLDNMYGTPERDMMSLIAILQNLSLKRKIVSPLQEDLVRGIDVLSGQILAAIDQSGG